MGYELMKQVSREEQTAARSSSVVNSDHRRQTPQFGRVGVGVGVGAPTILGGIVGLTGVTRRVSETEWVLPPPMPVIMTVEYPVGVVDAGSSSRVEVPDPGAGIGFV